MPSASVVAELLKAIRSAHPGLNLSTVDLSDPKTHEKISAAIPDAAKNPLSPHALQRAVRMAGDDNAAAVLLSEGMDSAHRITVLGRGEFIRRFASKLGVSEDGATKARTIYDKASVVKTRVANLVAALRGTISSRHSSALPGANISPDLTDHFQNLSSYQTIFGSLNYCNADNQVTILSPAAYLVDLLRVIDLAITVPNTSRPDLAAVQVARKKNANKEALSPEENRILFEQNIPPGLTLNERRPDLGNIQLTVGKTYDEVLYLEVVNAVLLQTVRSALAGSGALQEDNVFLTLANTYYPFDLPYNYPLDQMRRYLAPNSSLADIYSAFLDNKLAAHLEYLGLSAEQRTNLTAPKPEDLDKRVSKNYGLPISKGNLAGMDELDKFLARTGLSLTDSTRLFLGNLSSQEIFDTSGQYQTKGLSTNLVLSQQNLRVKGQFSSGVQGTLDGVLAGLVVKGYWQQTSNGAETGGSFEFTFAEDGSSFKGRWRKGYAGEWEPTSWDGSRDPATVTAGIIPHSFFINKVLQARQYLQATDQTVGSVTKKIIRYQSVETLDTINRFVRLAAVLGWTFPDLNWVLNTLSAPKVDGRNLTCTAELDDKTFVELAKIKKLTVKYGLSLDLATSMWFDLRTIGIGTGQESAAPFDVIFNSPHILRQFPDRTIYRPKISAGPTSYVNPLYTDDPAPWSRTSSIVAAIPTSADNLAAIASAAFGPDTAFTLTVGNLSLLYRHVMLAQQLNLPITSYIYLLKLLNLVDKNGLLAATLDRDQLIAVFEAVRWINDSGMAIPDLLYLVTGVAGPYASSGYDPANLPALFAALLEAIQATLVRPDTFICPTITAAESAAYFEVLVNAGYVDPIGIVLKDAKQSPPNFSNVPNYDPVLAAPDPQQISYIVTVLARQATSQAEQAAGVLATFFGSTSDTLVAALSAAGVWMGLENALEPFVLPSLFAAAADSVQTNGLLDKDKVIKVFQANNITLPPSTSLSPLTATTWTIQSAPKAQNFTAVTNDLLTIAFYSKNVFIFRCEAAEVMTANQLVPEKLIAVFAKNGISLGTDVSVQMIVRPLSWKLQDDATNTNYFSTQSNALATQVTFRRSGVNSATAQTASDLVGRLSRFVILISSLPVGNQGLTAIGQVPEAFGFIKQNGKPVEMTLDGIYGVYRFYKLIGLFQDTSNSLAQYLVAVRSIPDAGAADHLLCAITGWNVAQCSFAREKLFKTEKADTVARIGALENIFAQVSTLGADVYRLWQLAATALVPATPEGYKAAAEAAGALLEALRAKSTPDAWPTVLQQLQGPLLQNQRDALVSTALLELGKKYADITTPGSLYEFLLLDVEMSGCARISVVKEALNAAQLYLQRCRLSLERNVTISTDDLPNVWWEWLLNYRLWQANREIFLYPENYLDPGLRHTKTQLFNQLENDLLQGDVTADRVETEFRKYLDGLASLARLQIVDASQAVVHDPDRGPIDTFFMFARTDSQPYKFYYMKRERIGNCKDSSYLWSEWIPIDITINSDAVTSVYAFGRLLVFWNEITTAQQLDGTGNPNARATVTTASVMYSYPHLSGGWLQPQTLTPNQGINVIPTTSQTASKDAKDDKDPQDPKDLYGPFASTFAVTPEAMWGKISCLRIPATVLPDGTRTAEKLSISFGPMIDYQSGDQLPPPPDANAYAANPAVQSFVRAIQETTLVRNQLQKLSTPGTPNATGRTPLFWMVLDGTLQPSSVTSASQYLLLRANDLTPTRAPSFGAGLNGTSLLVKSSAKSLTDNYETGLGLTIPHLAAANGTVSAGSFASDYITAADSQNFYNILTFPGSLVDPTTGKVLPAVEKVTAKALAAALSTSEAVAKQVLSVLLDVYFGSTVLLSSISMNGAEVFPVNNQPGKFVLSSGTQTFLFESGTAQGARFGMLDAALSVQPVFNAVTAATLLTRDVTVSDAWRFYQILTTDAINLVNKTNGVVNKDVVTKTTVQALAAALTTDVGRAQVIRNILLSNAGPYSAMYADNSFTVNDSVYTLQFQAQRLNSSVIDNLLAALQSGGIAGLLALGRQQLPVNFRLAFDGLGPNTTNVPLGPQGTPLVVPPVSYFGDQVDFDGPLGLYFWELFFHAPLLIAKMLRDNQQFQASETWMQYIFNPTLPIDPLTQAKFVAIRPNDITADQAKLFYGKLTTGPNPLIDSRGNVLPAALKITIDGLAKLLGTVPGQALEIKNLLVNQYLAVPTGRYWQFQPFRNHTLQSLKEQLTNCAQIAAYNNDPFDPHAIARLRIGAYEKTVVMAYIENLLDWGDSEFSKYTWESIVTARMLYAYASDLLGPRPVDLGPCAESAPTTFNIILARYGGDPNQIPQFLIEMENALPDAAVGEPVLTQAGRPFNDLGGVFTVPENSRLLGLWDTTEDRIYKIWHCLNIEGKPQPLPLFEPPINPMDLVRAAAAGNNLLELQSQLQPAVPAFRFTAMIQAARSAVETLRSFGSALLQALEQRDANGLSLLQASHELAILNMMTLTKRKAIEDLQAQLLGLQQSLASVNFRQTYYNQLISQGLIAAEIAAVTLMAATVGARIGASAINGIAIAGYLAPNIFGLADGGMQFGDAVNAGAQIANTVGDIYNQNATISQTVGEFQRRAADWTLQSKLAGYEITEITNQIGATNARIASAQQELAAHLQQIQNAAQELQYLQKRFTNQDLYRWMVGRLATLYFQAYRLTQQLALLAQTAYQFELDRSDQIVTFNYWDNLRQGLLAGEGLAFSLEQLQKAYLDNDERRLEVQKTVSLRQTFPAAFVGFIWGFDAGDGTARPGQLDFVLPESLFDFDFPGHYCRKIKSISISIPCLLGPYQELHATLSQNVNAVVLEPNVAAVKYVAQRISSSTNNPDAPPAGTVRENWAPSQAIAVSRSVDETGLFVLDFNDERYLPFEGTGAVSAWSFSMPPETNPIDFSSISDVIVTVRYTAKDGGSAFAQQVRQYYRQQANTNPRLLNATFLLSRSFSSQWFQAMNTPPVNKTQTILFSVPGNIVLPNLRNPKLKSVIIQLQVAGGVAVSSTLAKEFVSLQINSQPPKGKSVSITNNFGQVDANSFSNSFANVPWSLVWNLANAPEEILTKNKDRLDPQKLLDVAIAVVYTADPF